MYPHIKILDVRVKISKTNLMKNTKQLENRETFVARLRKFTKDQAEIDEIMFAYDMAKEAHRTANRDSGERYFEHPRATALIMLDELKWFDKNSLIAMLLHDVGEDTPILGNVIKDYDEFIRTAKFRLGKTFNPEVAELVILLTKPSVDGKRFTNKAATADFYIKQLVKNPKALLLKMVDRLHNLRSLKTSTVEKTEKILKETIDVYLPIFEKLTSKKSNFGLKAEKLLKLIEEKVKSLPNVNSRN
ncbi:MAG: RelA/SpoT family protein [Candidatus Nomurabacteria bacterium GW2011_GWB1_37_5]|uniref:RelA/SpoT family protein n=1 Tax=Candidatus Nomurabacteria bacterium GW2011_GWB1_37_5 TaxID=1618742 RepID=A0A0G0JGA0_9BACT|nr:MAG: RelA/SpoT family protein [Candidatus Nomurabacteria bacterium GW2011_GWB1_37_5]